MGPSCPDRRGRQLAHRDGRCIAAGLVGGAVEIGELHIGEVPRVEADVGGVLPAQPFEELLGGEDPPTDRRGLDTGGLVDLVAESGDLGPGAGGDPADVEGRTPMQTEPNDEFRRIQITALGDRVDGVANRAPWGSVRDPGDRPEMGTTWSTTWSNSGG